MTKSHGPSIKNAKKYEALRKKGMSEKKAARISNDPNSGKKGGKAKDYEDRSKQELYDKSRQVGIDGRSKMTKQELISALRNA